MSATSSSIDTEVNKTDSPFCIRDGVLISVDNDRIKGEQLIIPSGVTTIAEGAFKNCSNLISVIIPEEVTSIGSHAFENCKFLQSVIIPKSIQTIEEGTFSQCTSLESVTLPEGLTDIKKAAFYYCNKLVEISIPESVRSIGKYAFEYCAKLESVKLSEGLEIIDDSAFRFCSQLESLHLPTTLNRIGDQAFAYCENLKAVVIPDNTKVIENAAFGSCIELAVVTLSDAIKRIRKTAFDRCSQLQSVVIKTKSEDEMVRIKAMLPEVLQDKIVEQRENKKGIVRKGEASTSNQSMLVSGATVSTDVAVVSQDEYQQQIACNSEDSKHSQRDSGVHLLDIIKSIVVKAKKKGFSMNSALYKRLKGTDVDKLTQEQRQTLLDQVKKDAEKLDKKPNLQVFWKGDLQQRVLLQQLMRAIHQEDRVTLIKINGLMIGPRAISANLNTDLSLPHDGPLLKL